MKLSRRLGPLVLVLATLLLRGCAGTDAGHRFPEPPISPAWHQGTAR